MKVTLIDFTGKGRPNYDETWHAADLLLFTKSTRLQMTPTGLDDIRDLPLAVKMSLLAEMAKTIPSSWEFVDVVFLIEGVTRACAQQITRTRTASYAMQSQRVADLTGAEVTNPFDPREPFYDTFHAAAWDALSAYADMLESGAAAQDARGVLPMNVQCNLVAKYNLRAFVDLVHSRSSLRTQSEYASIVRMATEEVRKAWPWVDPFFESPQSIAIQELEAVALELGVVPGSGAGWRVAKAIDLLRKVQS
jgi:flavin-dependent thymidylate synthase